MRFVWLWVTRPDGQVEQHIGPLGRYLRESDGRALTDEHGEPRYDEAFAAACLKLVDGYAGRSARDVALDITPKAIAKDKTGALQTVATALTEIADRVVVRQRRGQQGRMRAVWLADFELEQMTVNVRAE